MTERQRLGDFGERVAAAHLEANGYRILDTNFRVREGEVDIVAEREGVVAFVEVKTRRGDAMGKAVEGVTAQKAQRLLLAAEAYGQQHPDLPPGRRIDLIAIDLDAQGRVVSLEHIESAVVADPGVPGVVTESPCPLGRWARHDVEVVHVVLRCSGSRTMKTPRDQVYIAVAHLHRVVDLAVVGVLFPS